MSESGNTEPVAADSPVTFSAHDNVDNTHDSSAPEPAGNEALEQPLYVNGSTPAPEHHQHAADALSAHLNARARAGSRAAMRRFSVGELVSEQRARPNVRDRLRRATRRLITLKRAIQLLKSRDRRQVEQAAGDILVIINAPQNAGILNDIGLEPVLVSLLRLDPLSHWKIVGNALHGLYTLSLNPKCARSIIQSPDIELILEQFLRSERLLIQRLTAGIICRVFRQPLQYEWEIMANEQFLSLLMSLFDTSSMDVQLEALNVCNDLTYHVENTASLCEHQDFVPKLTQVVSRSDPLTRYVGLQVLRNVVSAAQVYPSILRAIRSVAKELEKSLLQHYQAYQEFPSLPALSHQQSMVKVHDPFRQTALEEQRFVADAMYLETKEMIIECLWFIRTCFSRIRPDSVQPEHSKTEFVSKLQHVAATMVP